MKITTYEAKRLQNLRKGLRKGDVRKIALLAGVSRVWVSRVLHGHDRSERILEITEMYLMEKHKNIRAGWRKRKAADTDL